MRVRTFFPFLLAFTMIACGDSDTADTPEPGEQVMPGSDWQVLFDGTSFDAWRGYQQEEMAPGWEIIDGAMVQSNPNSEGDIVTKNRYANFELEFEWLVPERGNSGAMFRVTEDHDTPWATGPEYQLMDDIGWGEGQAPKNRAGSNYDVYAPSESVTKPAGEWNTTKIIVDGAHVEHWLNGMKIVEYELWTDQWKADVAGSKWVDYPDYGLRETGYIAFQGDHTGVSLRNIRIRSL